MDVSVCQALSAFRNRRKKRNVLLNVRQANSNPVVMFIGRPRKTEKTAPSPPNLPKSPEDPNGELPDCNCLYCGLKQPVEFLLGS